MCIILLALRRHPQYPLILLANRDEFYQRPSLPMHQWPQGWVAGKDQLAGGTWLAFDRQRLALVTNYRDPAQAQGDRSRGQLVLDYFRLSETEFRRQLEPEPHRYGGYNLLFGRGTDLFYQSNRDGPAKPVSEGIHGLSNALLDSPWPKVDRGKQRLAEALGDLVPEQLFDILRDPQKPDDADLPDTGIGLEKERMLSSIFIKSPNYGSRCATVLLRGSDGVQEAWERDYRSGTTVHVRWQPGESPKVTVTSGAFDSAGDNSK